MFQIKCTTSCSEKYLLFTYIGGPRASLRNLEFSNKLFSDKDIASMITFYHSFNFVLIVYLSVISYMSGIVLGSVDISRNNPEKE